MRKNYKYHYLYKVQKLDTKEYYIGIRSCDVDPIDDDYWGSGIRITATVTKHGKNKFEKTILEVFDTRKKASLAEQSTITEEMLVDPLCLNLKTGGEYETGALYSSEVGQKISQSVKSYYENIENRKKTSDAIKKAYAENPEYKERIKQMRQRALKNPIHRAKVLEVVRRSFLETDRCERIRQAVNTPEAKAKKSKSIKEYTQTEKGRENLSKATKGKIWVTRDNQTTRIELDNLQEYIADGWIEGFKIKQSTETKQKLGNATRGKKHIFNPVTGERTRVSIDDLNQYLSTGWILGLK